jgi:hypothetical protein
VLANTTNNQWIWRTYEIKIAPEPREPTLQPSGFESSSGRNRAENLSLTVDSCERIWPDDLSVMTRIVIQVFGEETDTGEHLYH